MINVMIAGSRTLSESDVKKLITNIMLQLKVCRKNNVNIITGGAKGVDIIARMKALDFGFKVTTIRPIDVKDKFSYLLRNAEMIGMADKVFIFWDGYSKGTKFVIDYCEKRGKNYEVINYEKPPKKEAEK